MSLLHRLSRITFSNPDPNAIVILYSADDWIRRLILGDLKATTLPLYHERVHVTPTLALRLLRRLGRIEWRLGKGEAYFKSLLRQLYAQYILACLDQIGAKVVLTIVDNSSLFQYLNRLDEKRTYFTVQNGARTLFCVRDSLPKPPHPFAKISMTNFFCFGQRDVDLFSKHGHAVGRYIPVGSLVGGYFQSVVAGQAEAPQFDLCLISQWHEHFFSEIAGHEFEAEVSRRVAAGINGLNRLLSQLVEETGLRLVICPRDANEDELAFFERNFRGRATIARPDRENFSTYRAIKQSKLAIALNSTPLLEAFAWGHKTLWCNIPEDERFEMLEAGISYFSGDDYAAFKARVLQILDMPQDEYMQKTGKGAHYINNFDPAHPPHELIRAEIVNALGIANPDKGDAQHDKHHAGHL